MISCSVPCFVTSFSNLDSLFSGAQFNHLWASASEKRGRCLRVMREETMRKRPLLLAAAKAGGSCSGQLPGSPGGAGKGELLTWSCCWIIFMLCLCRKCGSLQRTLSSCESRLAKSSVAKDSSLAAVSLTEHTHAHTHLNQLPKTTHSQPINSRSLQLITVDWKLAARLLMIMQSFWKTESRDSFRKSSYSWESVTDTWVGKVTPGDLDAPRNDTSCVKKHCCRQRSNGVELPPFKCQTLIINYLLRWRQMSNCHRTFWNMYKPFLALHHCIYYMLLKCFA